MHFERMAMNDDTRRKIYNAIPCRKRFIMWCSVEKNLRCDVIKILIDDATSRGKIFSMNCHTKKNLKRGRQCNVTQKKLYHELSCEKDLKRNLRCNATRKEIYHEVSYGKNLKKT